MKKTRLILLLCALPYTDLRPRQMPDGGSSFDGGSMFDGG